MGTGKKVAIGAGAVMALGGIYKGIQYFTHSQAKKSDDEVRVKLKVLVLQIEV